MKVQSKEYSINNSTVRIIFGDILESQADVIVNTISSHAQTRASLSYAILPQSGEQVREDVCKMIPAKIGDVIVSTAGKLKQKYIFHAVLDEDIKDEATDCIEDVHKYILTHSIKRCFALMKVLNLNSIAFPCLGAERLRIPYSKIAKCMAKNICHTLMTTGKILNVEIHILDEKEDVDILPFFEWFASYSHLAKKELDADDNQDNATIDSDNVEIRNAAEETNIPADIFISYSRKDTSAAKVICGLLNDMNVAYWIDVNGIYSGNNFKEKIVNAITQAKIVLFLSSENSNKSSHVAKEIAVADKYQKVIIPIRLDATPFNPKMDYDLSDIDAIDMSKLDAKSLGRLRNAILGQITMNS